MKDRSCLFSHLMSYNTVLIIKAEIRAGVVRACEKSAHFVLVKVCHAGEAVVIIVINVVHAAFAVGGFTVIHHEVPPSAFRAAFCSRA